MTTDNQPLTTDALVRALARARRGSLTIGEDGSSFFVHRFGLTRFKSLPELSKFVDEVNGVGGTTRAASGQPSLPLEQS